MNEPKKEEIMDTDITVLYEPQKEINCVADVVFVHGLQGHPRNTWLYKGKSASKWSINLSRKIFAAADATNGKHEKDVFWPKELLPYECPSARIMTWGYDSKVSGFFDGSANQNSFYDHANDLLYALDRKRKDTRDRPLIFVMHSLGGIVVKQALVYSDLAEGNPNLQFIERSTKALIFFGTPHRGSTYATWGNLAARIAAAALFDVNVRNINALESHGQLLAELEKSFGRLIMHDHFTIHNFQETQGFKGVGYLNERIVEPWSASIGDPGKERTETINANHMNMCRFSGVTDPGYIKASSEIASRVEELRNEKSESMSREYDEFISALGENVSIGIPSQVNNPQPGTFTWAANDPRIHSWLRHRHGMFAVKGKAGSGKSTMMKYLHDNLIPETRLPKPLLKASFFFSEQGSVSDKSSLSMLRSLLYQLFEGDIDTYNLVLEELKLEVKRSARGSICAIEWTTKFLENILFLVVERAENIRVLVLIDALDECSEYDRSFVISFLHRWCQKALKSKNILDICISSRPEPEIDTDLSEVLTGSLLLQNENYRDIAIYVNERLGSTRDPRRLLNHYANFAASIAEMADGVFLWVVLIVPTLKKAIARGDTEFELDSLLKQIPKELKELYKSILRKIEKDCLPVTMRMMQIAVVAERPLELDEFQHMLAFSPNSRFTSFQDWEVSSEYIECGPMMSARLQSRSGGLLEVCDVEDQFFEDSLRRRNLFKDYFDSHTTARPEAFPQSQDDTDYTDDRSTPVLDDIAPKRNRKPTRASSIGGFTRRRPIQWNDSQFIYPDFQCADTTTKPRTKRQIVRLIHETAKSFFVHGEGFHILWETIRESLEDSHQQNPFISPDNSYLIAGHDYIVRCCASYLDLREIRLLIREVFSGLLSKDRRKFALLVYISESCFHHISAADTGGLHQDWIMSHFISRIGNVESFICWASKHHILSWLDLAKRLGGDFDATEHSYGQPIRVAVGNGYLEVVERLILGGANVNGTTGGRNTTLLQANRLANMAMVKLLLKHGAVMDQLHYLPPAGLVVRL